MACEIVASILSSKTNKHFVLFMRRNVGWRGGGWIWPYHNNANVYLTIVTTY